MRGWVGGNMWKVMDKNWVDVEGDEELENEVCRYEKKKG